MIAVTPTELRSNIYKLLDEVLRTGIPIEVNKGEKTLRIVPVEKPSKLNNLQLRPDVIQGNPDNLVEVCWQEEVNLDLP